MNVIQKQDATGSTQYYPESPFYPRVKLRDAELRGDTRSVSFWRKKVLQATHSVLRASDRG